MHWQCSVKAIKSSYNKDEMVLQKKLSREYKRLKHNVPPDSKLLFGVDLNNKIKLLQASNKACKVNITSSNSRYYQTYISNFS